MKKGWRPIIGSNGYRVSLTGKVKNAKCKTMRSFMSAHGYEIASIPYGSVRKNKPVHRLVAEAFLGPAEAGMCVNHKDGVKTNNHVSNLEYITLRGNTQHAKMMGLCPKGEAIPNAKLNPMLVRLIRFAHSEGISIPEIARAIGVSRTCVGKAARGQRWAHVWS